uniref:Uncharacterized protein n=1 Tax=Timema douglasi TaxID=61478 RepID=A0A7R8VNF0_TIMDO|nr:unnamed protein product [Timema douglasi]
MLVSFDAETSRTSTNLVVNQGSFFLPSPSLSTFFHSYQVGHYIRCRVPAHNIAIYCISALKEGLQIRHDNDEDEDVGFTATLDGMTNIQ